LKAPGIALPGMTFLFKLSSVRFESIDGFDKSGFFACHDHVNGVEVFFTAKTSCQVGFWVYGRLKFAAKRAEKAEMAFTDFGRYFQSLLYQGVNWDVVSQFKQLVLGKAFHVSSLPGSQSG
jgi:hypothetical protein